MVSIRAMISINTKIKISVSAKRAKIPFISFYKTSCLFWRHTVDVDIILLFLLLIIANITLFDDSLKEAALSH
jgi:hypothetical protein